MQLFSKILFPTDFSNQSNLALKFVIDLAQQHNSDLIILHTFRLTGEGLEDEVLLNAKRDLEQDAINKFKTIENLHLKNANIGYMFQSEVGFISDRIISNVKTHKIDLLILCRSIQDKIMERAEKDSTCLSKKMTCPIILVPKG